jgi:hypothetical protein
MGGVELGRSGAEWAWRGGQSGPSGRTRDIRLDRAFGRISLLNGPTQELGPRLGPLISAAGSPASLDQIAEAELQVGTAIPIDYTRFLLRWNGLSLLVPPGQGRPAPIELRLLGTDLLPTAAAELEARSPGCCIPDLVLFAAVGDGDGLAFAAGRTNPLGGCAVLDARRGCPPERWWVIARDFTSWLVELLRPGRAAASLGRDWSDELQLALPFDETDELETKGL